MGVYFRILRWGKRIGKGSEWVETCELDPILHSWATGVQDQAPGGENSSPPPATLCVRTCVLLSEGRVGLCVFFFFSVFSVRKENGCFPPPSSLSLILTSPPIHSQAPISPGAADEIFPFFPLYKCWWEMTHSFSHSLTHTRAYTHTHTLTHAWWQMGSDVTGPSRVLGSQSYELLLTADATESFQEIETLESCLLLSCWSQHMPEKGRVLITQAVFFFFFLRG